MKPEYLSSMLALAVISMVVFDWFKRRRNSHSGGNPGVQQETLGRIEHNQEKAELLLQALKESSVRQETLQTQMVREITMLRTGNPGPEAQDENRRTDGEA